MGRVRRVLAQCSFGVWICLLWWGIQACPLQKPSEPEGEPVLSDAMSLVDHLSWRKLQPELDPFSDTRPDKIRCVRVAGYGYEEINGEASLQIRTEFCNYLTATQRALADVPKGAQVKLRIWLYQQTPHDRIPTAKLAIRFGTATVWEKTLEIPTKGKLLSHTWPSPVALKKGEPIAFHLRNHGANSYHLIELSVRWWVTR